MDAVAPYATHEIDGFTVESNTATVEQMQETFAPPVVEPANGDTPGEESSDGDTPVEQTAEGEPAAEAQTDDDRDEKGRFKPKEKARDNAYTRMQQAIAKAAEERTAREAAEARIRELEARHSASPAAAEKPVVAEKFPAFDKYLETHPEASWDDWNDANIEHRANLIAERQLQAYQQTSRDEQRLAAHNARVTESLARYPDFKEALIASDQLFQQQGVVLNPVLRAAILDHPHSADVLYFLATHHEEALQLARETAVLGPDAAPLVRRFLSSTVSAGAASSVTGSASAPRSQAKPPVRPVGGSASAAPVKVDDLEFGPEYVRRMNKLDQERGRRF